MRAGRAHAWGRALLAGVLALLVQACAVASSVGAGVDNLGVPTEAFGSGSDFAADLDPAPPTRDAETDERARGAETERALAQLWAVLDASNAPGTTWRFRYWAQDGALTLLSFQRVEEGEGRGAPVDRDTFVRGFARNLPTLLGSQAREVVLTLERGETRWSLSLDSESKDRAPAEARTLPLLRPGVTPDTYQQVMATARAMAQVMEVPAGGRATLVAEVMLEDERVTGWELKRLEVSGDGRRQPATEQAVSAALNALLPFTSGLGARTVRLEWEGTHRRDEQRPRWSVVEAGTLRPPPPPEELEDIAGEYRAMHERILREWRGETREAAVMMAGFTTEQLAWWVVGGFLTKRVLVLFKAVAPTLTSVLSKGGTHAVRWFRTLLIRMSPAEKATLQRLWLKAETRGLDALTAAERAEFRALMGRLEQLLHTPISGGDGVKNSLRRWARTEYFQFHNPQLAQALGKNLLKTYDVHHKIPLEYAHLFPRLDINARTNLAGVSNFVHESINTVWTAVRPASRRITPEEVQKIAAIIDKHYGRWFDVVYNPGQSAPALVRAEQAALREVRTLLHL